MRLNRYLAQSGLGSRRAVEQLILDGKVTLNGQPVRDLATQAAGMDIVEVEGRRVRPAQKFQYIMLNKPRGYDVTRGGRHHHRRAWDLLPDGTHASVQSVGRLDRDSTGLLLFTNDGELAFRLAHPRYGCRKVYEVDVEGKVEKGTLQRLLDGVDLEDGPAKALKAEILPALESGQTRLRVAMAEGRKHIVRRMCEAVGNPVIALNRISLGPLTMEGLARGKTRPLTRREIDLLKKSVGLEVVEDNKPSHANQKPVKSRRLPRKPRPAR